MLNYGFSTQKLEINKENLLCLVKTRRVLSKYENIKTKIIRSLNNPIGSPLLEKIASSNDKVALVIDDVTRPTPTHIILPIIIKRLRNIGLKRENILILIATGAHKFLLRNEVKTKIGKTLIERINIRIHDCLRKNALEMRGFSIFGTPIWIDKYVLNADLKIGIGTINPHPWAGFSGGAKIILPGVSSWESINRNHFLAISENAKVGNLNENPIRKDIEDVAHKIGLDMILNVITDNKKRVIEVVTGDMIKAHRKGVKVCKRIFENKIREKADIMIVAFGPNDRCLWDVIAGDLTRVYKGLLKKNGTLIIVARCPYGIYKYGLNPYAHVDYTGKIADYSRVIEFLKLRPKPEEVLSETIRGNMPYSEVGIKAYFLAKFMRENDIFIVSHVLKNEDINWFGKVFHKVQDALNEALKFHGKDANVLIFPNMGNSYAYTMVN